MKFKHRPQQLVMRAHALEQPRCAIHAGMGTGKTRVALEVAALRLTAGDVRKVLVIAPLRVARDTWTDERDKWEDLHWLRISRVIGDEAQRREALAADAQVYTVNYENLEWLAETVGDSWPWDFVIADESTKLKGFRLRQGTKRTKVLARPALRFVMYWMNLTGTPAPNGLKDLWGQMWFLDAGQRLRPTYNAYMETWFVKDYMGYNWEPREDAFGKITERIEDICLSVRAEDYMDIKKPVVSDIHVRLPERARMAYVKMERESFAEIAEAGGAEAFGAAARTGKLLQMASGSVYLTDSEGRATGEYGALHDAKLDALEDIIEEAAGMPVLVVHYYKHSKDRILKRLKQAKALDQKTETLRAWNKGKIPVMLLHPASAGHGLSLQDGGNIIVFFDLDWNLELYEQVIERIGPTRQAQSGYDRPVYVYRIVADSTVDEDVLDRLEGKASVAEALQKRLSRITSVSETI